MTYTIQSADSWGGDHCTVTVYDDLGQAIDIYHAATLSAAYEQATDDATRAFWLGAYRDCLNASGGNPNS